MYKIKIIIWRLDFVSMMYLADHLGAFQVVKTLVPGNILFHNLLYKPLVLLELYIDHPELMVGNILRKQSSEDGIHYEGFASPDLGMTKIDHIDHILPQIV